ncbi:MAG: hypothetical protein IT260_21430 [Saprospiraceae bacterium]|nr:hypothetical protein [Saprospiraceae bacterium]
MQLDSFLKILLFGGSLTAGAYLTALRAKLVSTKQKNWLHWAFYIIPGFVLVASISIPFLYWREVAKPDIYAIALITLNIVFSFLLIQITKKSIVGKYQYTVKELNPVVNEFSTNADKGTIKLLAGNLDFFGQSGVDIENHPQYKCLREESFREILILCTAPVTDEDKFRYGKIVTDFPTVQLRYYKPLSADLKIRGRIKTLNNVTRLLIYSKVSKGVYEALELNTADTTGAHYSHLWNLIWELAEIPSPEELDTYKRSYRPLNQ